MFTHLHLEANLINSMSCSQVSKALQLPLMKSRQCMIFFRNDALISTLKLGVPQELMENTYSILPRSRGYRIGQCSDFKNTNTVNMQYLDFTNFHLFPKIVPTNYQGKNVHGFHARFSILLRYS